MRTFQEEKCDHKLWQKLLAEAVGTFALTWASAATAVLEVTSPQAVGPLQHALAPALVVAALIFAMGNVSGAHFNPIVTLAFFLRRVFPGSLVVPYILMQSVGSLLAAVLVDSLWGDVQFGITEPSSAVAVAFSVEILLSALLVTVILGTATRHQIIGPHAAIPVGCTIALCGFMGDAMSGASMNPARSLGPALISGELSYLWIYLVGPPVGAFLAVVLTWALHSHQHRAEKEAAAGV